MSKPARSLCAVDADLAEGPAVRDYSGNGNLRANRPQGADIARATQRYGGGAVACRGLSCLALGRRSYRQHSPANPTVGHQSVPEMGSGAQAVDHRSDLARINDQAQQLIGPEVGELGAKVLVLGEVLLVQEAHVVAAD